MPPPPPRQFSDSYVWRLMQADGWYITAFVFIVLGAVFTGVGAGLTISVITAFVGVPFVILGILFLAFGGAVGVWRYQLAAKTLEVLRVGAAAEGQILRVEENLHVRVNQRHPWIITYQFQADGREYEGRVATLNMPGPILQPGKKARMLYLPDAPEHNVLYPHP